VKTYHEVLAEGKGETVRFHLKEAGEQNHEPTYRNGIQGQVRGRVCTTKRSPDLTGYGKCRGCVVKVHVLIRGDFPDRRLWRAASQVATSGMIGKESAEAIVAPKERRAKHELGGVLDELF
jgi:hypothetical protein